MCGVFGFTNFRKEDLGLARKSLHTLHHRGPDQWNDYYNESIYIGHQRLSILDLSEHGKQPMIDPTGNVIITVNGEIYNFLEIKNELKSKYEFNSTSDSEIILYGYIEWGIDKLLEKIDGMYALCIHDRKNNLLYLARDRAGIKPLFYSVLNNQISWSSEPKAIHKLYEDTDLLTYDHTAFYDFLTYSYVPTPKTIYKDIFKLEPAHLLTIDTKTCAFTKEPYWKLKINKCNDNIEIAKKKIYALVDKSVEKQMIADVPIGFFLSGGLDSSTIVALASHTHNDINTFSIGFENNDRDETYFSKLVANTYKTKHHNKNINENIISGVFNKIVHWYDEPNAVSSSYPTYFVSKLARENSTVVLTGDGGDEVFGGYNWYKEFELIKKHNKPSFKFLRPLLQILQKHHIFRRIAKKLERSYLLDDLEIYTLLMSGMLKEEKEKYRELWNIENDYDDYWYFRKYYREELENYTKLQYLDFHTFLPDNCLSKVDRTSMSVSLECRIPLLSKEIIEYGFSLKDEVRIHNSELKGAMKEAFRKILPVEILERDKKGFSAPLMSIFKSLKLKPGTRQEKHLEKFWGA